MEFTHSVEKTVSKCHTHHEATCSAKTEAIHSKTTSLAKLKAIPLQNYIKTYTTDHIVTASKSGIEAS